MNIDLKRKYQTKSGCNVKLYEAYPLAGGSDAGFEIHGAFQHNGSWYLARWDSEGKYMGIGARGNLDLIPKKKTVTLHGNIYLNEDSRAIELHGAKRDYLMGPFLFDSEQQAYNSSSEFGLPGPNAVQAKITFEVDE